MTTVLLSNDDGIDAPGLAALEAAMADVGEVWVSAPDRERSAVSHAISLHQPLRIKPRGERRFAVDGTPTDCVYLALNHLMPRPPDLVVSGINMGGNLGSDVLYSGTVAAAMEGALYGHRAIAVSLAIGDTALSGNLRDGLATAAACAVSLGRSLLQAQLPAGVLLNVNVPNRAREQIAGVKLCRLGFSDWADAVQARQDPRGRPYYWIGGERRGDDGIADSDNLGIRAGYITVTPVHYDLTDYRAFAATRAMRLEGFAFGADALGNEPLAHPVHARRNGR